MTLEDFNAFRESCYQRGFTHVLVGSDRTPLDLADWHPYGAFGGSNPSIEKHIKGFTWITSDAATDGQIADNAGQVILSGVWTFVREDQDDVLAEQHSNYNRMIGESLKR